MSDPRDERGKRIPDEMPFTEAVSQREAARMKHSWVLFVISALALAGTASAASTLYASTKIGPFKSTDSGVTWQQLIVTTNDPSLPGEPSTLVMAVDPQTPSTVYAFGRFTSASGSPLAFLKSTDSGATWSVVSKPAFSYTFDTKALLAIDPVKTNVLYTMNASDGMEVTMDGGVTWNTPTIPKPTGSPSGATANQPYLEGVAADPNHSGVVYVVGGNASFHTGKGYLLKSTDFGNSWTLLTSNAGFGSRIFINPKNSLEIYGTSLSNVDCIVSNPAQCGIYKSTDGGQSWTELIIPEPIVQIRRDRRHSGPALCGGIRLECVHQRGWRDYLEPGFYRERRLSRLLFGPRRPERRLDRLHDWPVGSKHGFEDYRRRRNLDARRSAAKLPMRSDDMRDSRVYLRSGRGAASAERSAANRAGDLERSQRRELPAGSHGQFVGHNKGDESGSPDGRLEPFDRQRRAARIARRRQREHGREAGVHLLHIFRPAQRARRPTFPPAPSA